MDLLNDLSFCVFDLETTGPSSTDDIIEIGLVKIENLKIVDQKSYLIRPSTKIPKFIQQLTSIKDQDVLNAPTIDEVILEIIAFMDDFILVAHNSNFDVNFLNAVIKKLKLPPLTNKVICTNIMTKHLIPELINSNLPYLCKLFKVEQKKAHRALTDALATANIFLKYLAIFQKRGIKKINHLYYPQNRYETDRITYTNQEKEIATNKIKEIKYPLVAALKDAKGVILFAIPLGLNDPSKNLLITKIKEIEYATITIRIFATFLQAMLTYYFSFYKLNSLEGTKILDLLKKNYLKTFDPNQKATHDFLIARHLIPGQFIIYPIFSLTPKSGLCFKYPSQKTKIYQYIKGRKNKGAIDKDPFIIFIFNYIREYKSNFFTMMQIRSKNQFDEIIPAFIEFTSQETENNYPEVSI